MPYGCCCHPSDMPCTLVLRMGLLAWHVPGLICGACGDVGSDGNWLQEHLLPLIWDGEVHVNRKSASGLRRSQ